MVNKSPIFTDINIYGNNYQTYVFQNGEQYKFLFKTAYFSNRIKVSIYDGNTPLIEDIELALSDNFFPYIPDFKGTFTIEGVNPEVDTIDNTSVLYYNYEV